MVMMMSWAMALWWATVASLLPQSRPDVATATGDHEFAHECKSLFEEPASRHRLRSLRFNHYSYSPPPATDQDHGHPVYVGLEIVDVDGINDAENYFSLQLHLFETWREPRLNTTALRQHWPHDVDPIPVLDTDISHCLWTPSLVFEQSTEKEHLLPPTSTLLARPDKVLLRKSRYSVKVRCHMNLQTYPMDKHLCHFRVRTFAHPVHRVELWWLTHSDSPKPHLLENRSVLTSRDFTPSLFDISVCPECRKKHLWLGDWYSVLEVEFVFERRIIHSLLTVYIPSSLIVTLSWLQFWFDVEAVPGRMSLGIMSTLTIMTQILTNYEKAGNHVTAVDIWLFVCLIMVFLALMEYAVAYTISHYYDNFASDDLAPEAPRVPSNRVDPGKSQDPDQADRIALAQLRVLQASEELELLVQGKLAETVGLISAVRGTMAEVHRLTDVKVVDDNNNAPTAAVDHSAAGLHHRRPLILSATQKEPRRASRLDRLGRSLRRQLSSRQLHRGSAATRLSQVDYGSRYLFPFAFILFAAIYWVTLIRFKLTPGDQCKCHK